MSHLVRPDPDQNYEIVAGFNFRRPESRSVRAPIKTAGPQLAESWRVGVWPSSGLVEIFADQLFKNPATRPGSQIWWRHRATGRMPNRRLPATASGRNITGNDTRTGVAMATPGERRWTQPGEVPDCAMLDDHVTSAILNNYEAWAILGYIR